MMPPSLSVSVVVSTYSKQRINESLRCVESLRRQKLTPKEIVLVVEPEDELGAFYRSIMKSDIAITASSGRGLSNARNTGIDKTSGEIVAFIDDDATAHEDWLWNFVQNYSDESVIGTGGLILADWDGGRPSWFPEELDWVVGCSYKGLPIEKALLRNPIGCSMSFRRSAFKRFGFFQTHVGRFGKLLLGSEEAEFSIRLLRQDPSLKIVYDPTAMVHHKVPSYRRSFRYLIKRAFFEGVSKRLLVEMRSGEGNVLFVENTYLKYLLFVAIPTRLRRIYRLKELLQTFTILISIFVVLVGYVLGSMMASEER
jgi:glycosyltransferase involved in cell wall biosynthesis